MARPRRPENAEPIDRLLHALGDPTRRRIVEMLSARPHAVATIADHCGITLTAVGQHIRVLEGAGLVSSNKLGRVRSCQIEPAGLAAVQLWLTSLRSSWDKRLDALEALLARQENKP